MTLFLDTSALLRRYIHGPGHELVISAMTADEVWCASALCRSETLLALHRLAVGRHQHDRLWSRLRDDWDAFVVVPVDNRCLAHAVDLGATCTWPRPTGCPDRCATPPSIGARSRPPTPSASSCARPTTGCDR